MNQWVQETRMQANKHVICPLIALKAILVDDVLVAFLVNLALEMLQVIVVIPLVTQVIMEFFVIM